MTKSFRIRYLLVVLLVTVTGECHQQAVAGSSKKIHVVFRYDDYSTRSSTELDLRLIHAFKSRGMRCTFGIIPFIANGNVQKNYPQKSLPLTEAKAAILRQAAADNVVEFALHGETHQTHRNGRPDDWTEFMGLSYEAQFKKISNGKNFLEEILGTPISIFIPPYNKYDENTLRALDGLGFRYLSADWYGHGLETSRLKFIPATAGLLDFKQAVTQARELPDPENIIVMLFHPRDFFELKDRPWGKIPFQSFEALLDWVKAQPDLTVSSMMELADTIPDLNAERYLAYKSFLKTEGLLPPFLYRELKSVYVSQTDIADKTPSIQQRVLLYYSLIFLLGFRLSRYIAQRLLSPHSFLFKSLRHALAFSFLGFILFVSTRSSVGYLLWSGLALLLAATLGSWLPPRTEPCIVEKQAAVL